MRSRRSFGWGMRYSDWRMPSPTSRRWCLWAAAAIQAIGALAGCGMLFAEAMGVADGGVEAARPLPWLVAPVSLVLSAFVAARLQWAVRLSQLLLWIYPLVPLLDMALLKTSLHGGEVGFWMMAFLALPLSAALLVLFRAGRNAVVDRVSSDAATEEA